MSIIRPSAPFSATAALFAGLPAFLASSNTPGPTNAVRKQAFIGGPPRIPTADDLGFQLGPMPSLIPNYSPIRVFVLNVGAVLKGQNIAAASVSAGWRYFVSQSPQASIVALAAVSQRPATGAWTMAATFFGPGVAALRQALNNISILQSATVDYELSFLTVPSLNLEAFHLKAADGSGDLLLPFPSLAAQLIKGLDAKEVYTEAEFLAVIRAIVPRTKSRVPHSGG
jgi:hypothetical protein